MTDFESWSKESLVMFARDANERMLQQKREIEALEALEIMQDDEPMEFTATISNAITALRAALAEPVQEPVAVRQFRTIGSVVWYDGYADHEDGGGPYEERTLYTAPPRCPNCASLEAQNTELDRKLAEIEASKGIPAVLMTTWVSETEAVTEPLYKAPRRLTDTEIGEVWFAARIPGLTETDARRLIRAVEARSGAR